jgi:branched-chain amino acid transport system permease protein
MAESDYAAKQGQAGRPRPTGRVAGGRAMILIGVAVLYGLVLFGLSLDQTLHFVLFACVMGAGLYGWTRVPALRRRAAALLEQEARFGLACVIVAVLAYPVLLRGNPYLIHVAFLAGVFALMAVGLNFPLGFAGLLDLGYAAYFAAGAYTSALLSTVWGLSFWLTLPLAGLMAACFGFVVAWPCLRVHDRYLALVTLGFGAIVELLARNLRPLTGGTDGILNIPPPSFGTFSFLDPLKLGPVTLPFQANFYYLTVALIGIGVVATIRLKNSRVGRSWEAIREDETAAACFGIDLIRHKLKAFTTGSFFAGLAGAVFAHAISFIHPDNFNFPVSMGVLCMAVAGGIGNVWGVITGAAFYVFVPERLREFEKLRLLLFGVSLLLLMRFRPSGIFPSVRRRLELSPEQATALTGVHAGADTLDLGVARADRPS